MDLVRGCDRPCVVSRALAESRDIAFLARAPANRSWRFRDVLDDRQHACAEAIADDIAVERRVFQRVVKNRGHDGVFAEPEVSDNHPHGERVSRFERAPGLPTAQLVRLEHRGDGQLDLG